MRFAEPNMLWVLAAVLPLFVGFLWWSWRAKERLMAQFVQSRLLASLMVGRSPRQQRIRSCMLVAAVALLLLSLARPQWGFTLEEAHQRGLDIVVVADTSRSMLAEDVTPNRLERAKLAALDLQRVARNDRLGLVVFAGSTFLQCPLTLDEEAFRQSVQVLDANIIEQGGSSLADAIEMAQTAFKQDTDNFKVIVLLTDGEDHEGGVMPVVEAAAKKGFRIFTIGVGTVEGELLRLRNEQGIPTLMKDEDGNIVRTRLNESMLQRIATAANGFYLPLQGTGTMETLYERGLAPLPKGDISSRMIRKYFERFQWVLGLAILLLAGEMFLPERERKRQSRRELVTGATTDSTATTAVTALLILSLLSPSGVIASPSSAAKQYQKGEYDGAWTEYQRLLKEGREDARLHFNAGASAYKAGRFADALRSFYSAQQTDDLQLQQKSYYNQGNAFYQLGEKSSDPDETMEHWEQAAASYERALKLDSKDADAQHNLEMVRRKLQQLEQQME
ncbi:MAG TPA: VWA domain-containing protein, partial [Roseimicrobium sp.]|nr:VWA domain-containing protein [Roseimicrobium sp.]